MSDTHLSLWHEGASKEAILDFIARVIRPESQDYVPPAQRVAVFDNDGTLWCERPFYIQLAAGLDFFAWRAEQDPALRARQPFEAAFERDLAFFGQFTTNDKLAELVKMLVEAAAGETQAEFEARASAWFAQARHPRFGVPYVQTAYAPMVQLLDTLRAHEFRVFICTGGGMDLVRLISEEVYGVPRENVIGSNMMLAWEPRDGGPVLVRQPAVVQPFNDGPGKPVNIQLHVGRPPILAAGNSNGDLAMMEFAAAGTLPCLNLLVRHDDAEREYVYTAGAEAALEACAQRGWCVVSMAQDWKTVF